MKQEIEQRKPQGLLDNISLAITTFGVGFIPGAPGTYGSLVGVIIYLAAGSYLSVLLGSAILSLPAFSGPEAFLSSITNTTVALLLLLLCLLGIWASGRSIELLGNTDPSEAVVDEVIGQLVTFLFVPFGIGWPLVLCGFLLFRLFDIWKPYPIDSLQVLPGGIGICADDLLAGIYAGICLSVIYVFTLAI